jgi:hypothetical protein
LGNNHPRILAEKWEKLAFATTAIFLRFPNKNTENPTLAENSFVAAPPATVFNDEA